MTVALQKPCTFRGALSFWLLYGQGRHDREAAQFELSHMKFAPSINGLD